MPTITGAIASVSLSGITTANISHGDIASISADLADIYGVDVEDIEITVDYIISGTLDVIIPEGVLQTDAIISIEESIGDMLGVHPSNVVVTIDKNGDVNYSVTGESYDAMEQIQNVASSTEFASDVTNRLNEKDSDIIVESSISTNEVEVVVSATVDTTDVTGIVEAESAIADLAQNYDFTESIVEGNKTLCYQK